MKITVTKHKAVYFTADTHFGQAHVIESSRRPFASVEEMDATLISNWNSRITDQDIVYHAGDLSDVSKLEEILTLLHYKELHLIAGHYERENLEAVREICGKFGNVYLCETGTPVILQGHRFYIRHEPVSTGNDLVVSLGKLDLEICLFGHIHGKSLVKRNGIDVGVDGHHFMPLSTDDIIWFLAKMKEWDENVYTDRVKLEFSRG